MQKVKFKQRNIT